MHTIDNEQLAAVTGGFFQGGCVIPRPPKPELPPRKWPIPNPKDVGPIDLSTIFTTQPNTTR
jgi:hypothetical protein